MKNILTLALLSSFLLLGSSHSLQAQKKKKTKKKDYIITIQTPKGDIIAILFDETPKHKENFLKLVDEGFYNGIGFHRVMKNFMIQTGDPNTKEGGDPAMIGRGGPGYTVEAEIVDLFKHEKGMIAAARRPDPVNPDKVSSGSQFYIVQNDKGTPHLDGNYTIFGKVIKGIDVVDAIAEVKVNGRGLPDEKVEMQITAEKLSKKKILKIYSYSFEQ